MWPTNGNGEPQLRVRVVAAAIAALVSGLLGLFVGVALSGLGALCLAAGRECLAAAGLLVL